MTREVEILSLDLRICRRLNIIIVKDRMSNSVSRDFFMTVFLIRFIRFFFYVIILDHQRI